MQYDQEFAAELAKRINEIMRDLPPEPQPITVLTALCAVMARLLSVLREDDREPAYEWAMSLVREHAGIRAN